MTLKRESLKICGQQVFTKEEFICFIHIHHFYLENSIRGLEEDETDFLSRIDEGKLEKQRQLKRLEQEEIEELKISFFSFDKFTNFSFG